METAILPLLKNKKNRQHQKHEPYDVIPFKSFSFEKNEREGHKHEQRQHLLNYL